MCWTFAYDSPIAITALLKQEELSMTKKFGQNFLISRSVREKIVALLDVQPSHRVWEIGPGIGAVTSLLLEQGAKVTAFEIDHGFCRILSEQAFADEPSFRLISGDALKTLPSQLALEGSPDRLCGNLPQCSTVVIARCWRATIAPCHGIHAA